jgi:hypothetical protein
MTSPRASPDTISASRSPRSRSSRSCSATRSAAFRHSAAEVRRIVKDLAAKDQAETPAQGGPVGESVEGPADFAIHDAGDVWRFDPPEFIVEARRQDILHAWGGALPPRGRLHFLIRQHFTLLDAGHGGWIRDYCRRRDITVVILDTWTRLSPGADPMSAQDQAGLATIVTQLADDIHDVVVVVDHTRGRTGRTGSRSPPPRCSARSRSGALALIARV